MQFYILTTRGYEALVRHFDEEYSDIQTEDAVVVINSLEKEYIKKVEAFCKLNKIEYYITECDGTPSKGKNSVLDIFLASKNNYCVMIDGDDFLTPHGVWMYQNLELADTPPDAVCLVNQQSLRYMNDEVQCIRPFVINYDTVFDIDFYTPLKEKFKLSDKKAKYFEDLHYKYFDQQKKYGEGAETGCRVTWLSRKAAKFRFDESLNVGEDTLQMLTLKHEALEGRLNFYSSDERPITYIYDERVAGTVRIESKFGADYGWMNKYLNALKEMEDNGLLHEYSTLPELAVDYPPNYELDDYGLNEDYIHLFKGEEIKLPKNATQASIKEKYTQEKKHGYR